MIENTAIDSQTMKIDELIGSLTILKGKEFFKDEQVLSKEGVFYQVLKDCKLLRYG